MDDKTGLPELRLEFIGASNPTLNQTVFWPNGRGKSASTESYKCRKGRGRHKFEWRQGVMALCYCLLDYVCWSKRRKVEAASIYVIQGEHDTPAKTLDNGLGQFLKWMNEMFGLSPDTQDCRLKEYIKRLNPDKATKSSPFTLEFQTELFPPRSIEVILNGEEIHDADKLEWLADSLAEAWHRKTGHMSTWKNFKAQRHEARGKTRITHAKRRRTSPRHESLKSRSGPRTKPCNGGAVNAETANLREVWKPEPRSVTVIGPGWEWPAQSPFDPAVFREWMLGKPPCVDKDLLVQLHGEMIKGYLHVTQPDVNPPPYYTQQEWLAPSSAIALSNALTKEPLKIVLGIFQDDEMGLRDWAKEQVAKAIWQNLQWQDELPRAIASASPRLKQVWEQECAGFFPPEAREKVVTALTPDVPTEDDPANRL